MTQATSERSARRGKSYDAVVVGAGPAGSATARGIAQQGFDVLLLEEHAAVGAPPHCSGLVTPRTLALAGVGDRFTINALGGARIHSAGGKRLCIGGERTRAYAIDRPALDRALAEQAQSAGAELLTGTRLTEIEHERGQVRLRLRREHRDCEITTRLLIGADGAQSRVAAAMRSEVLQQETLVGLGAEVRLRTERSDFVEVFAGNRIAPGFFGWMIPLGNGLARLGIATSNGARPVHYLKRLIEGFPQVFGGMDVLRYYGGLIPLKRLARICDERMLLAGDAAGHVKPTSGGGIYTALLGAAHCARTAVQALMRDQLGAGALAGYQAAWTREMGQELERGWDLRRAVLSLDDRQLDRLLGLLGNSALQKTIARHGDIDFPSALASRLLGRAPWLINFARLALRGPW